MGYIEQIDHAGATWWLPEMPSQDAAAQVREVVQGLLAESGEDMARCLYLLAVQGWMAVYDSITEDVFPAPSGRLRWRLLPAAGRAAGKLVTRLRSELPERVLQDVRAGASLLKAWREHLGITLRALSEISGIPHSTLQMHERSARPRRKTLETWALGLGIDRELLERTYAQTKH
ncbi:MAG: helix-turn-helix domain-containing protein [Desulfovibrio sp.]